MSDTRRQLKEYVDGVSRKPKVREQRIIDPVTISGEEYDRYLRLEEENESLRSRIDSLEERLSDEDLIEENEVLRHRIEMLQDWRENIYEQVILPWRGINILAGDIVCKKCSGSGTSIYDSASTWRVGISGQKMTRDVCDKCWGSGKENHPWPDHRKLGDSQ